MISVAVTATSTGANAQASAVVPEEGRLMGVALTFGPVSGVDGAVTCAAGLRGFSSAELSTPSGLDFLAYGRCELFSSVPSMIDQTRNLYFPVDAIVGKGAPVVVSITGVSASFATAIFFFEGLPVDYHVVPVRASS